jgi:uncharacterized protein (TIGR02284 family)
MKTTREEAREESHKELVNDLQELLEKNYDAEKGFKNAMEDSRDGNLKQFLKNQALQKNRFVTELDALIRSLNEEPKEKGSTKGDLHRAWMDIKTALSGNKDEAVLEECIRGEKASRKEYEEKLDRKFLRPEIAQVLQNHLNDINKTIAEVKTLEDLADRRD